MDYRDREAGHPPKFTIIREASSLSQREMHSRIRIETIPKKLAVARRADREAILFERSSNKRFRPRQFVSVPSINRNAAQNRIIAVGVKCGIRKTFYTCKNSQYFGREEDRKISTRVLLNSDNWPGRSG
jgi:hypothetical protein